MSKKQPSKTKYKKVQKGRNKGSAKGNLHLSFGDYGLQSIQNGYINANQIEAVRVVMTRHIKKKGKIWIRIFPHKPITKKPAETRMGKGKGNVEYYAAKVKKGEILFEMGGVSDNIARKAMSLADRKLHIKCRFISRNYTL